MQCCGSGMFIPDPNFSQPGRIPVQEDPRSGYAPKNYKYFLPKKLFLSFQKKIRDVHLGSGSWFFTQPDPRVKKAPDSESGSATLSGWFILNGWLSKMRWLPYFLGTFCYTSTTVTNVWSLVLGPRNFIFTTDFNLLKKLKPNSIIYPT